jgi:cysteine desulfurase
MEYCYFDYNATAPLQTEARSAWLAAADDLWLNPSSPYRAAARVRVHLEDARAQFAHLFEVAAERVVFHSGATEGNYAVFAHWAETLPADARIGVSATEHPSVVAAAKHFFGERVDWLDLDVNGAVDVAALRERLSHGEVAAVSVMAANNETGIINDWGGVAAVCRAQNVQIHCDAAQWVGKLPLNGLNICDFVTVAGHKFGGPRGVGLTLLPQVEVGFTSQVGGLQEFGHRAGTEDVAGIMAMLAALKVSKSGSMAGRNAFLAELNRSQLAVEIVGSGAQHLWNTVLLIMPEFASERWIRALEKRGFWVSAGAACRSTKQGPSPVLTAIGLGLDEQRRVLRVSSGWQTTQQDWLSLATAIAESYRFLRSEADGSGATVISI